jgi:hypothetical protein
MFPDHARASVAHNDPGLFTSLALVAMHGAVGARRLFIPKTAALQPDDGIIQEFTTIRA